MYLIFVFCIGIKQLLPTVQARRLYFATSFSQPVIHSYIWHVFIHDSGV